MDRDENIKLKCSFCGRTKEEVEGLLEGEEGCYICPSCSKKAISIFAIQQNIKKVDIPEEPLNLIPPKKIKMELDKHIIGQDNAKKTLSVAVHNHYKRIGERVLEDEVVLEKSNILLLGPTGSGKTLLARTLAKILNVPFVICDATTMTQAGYVGEDVEIMLLQLIEAADGDVQKAERGIIYLDEIDKIARKNQNVSITRDVSGEGVQQALLKILEGTIANVPTKGVRKHPNAETLKIDTTNILFICGGAFVDLDKIIGKRKNSSSIGFSSSIKDSVLNYSELMQDVTPTDLIQYGLIPELVGRLPINAILDPIDEEALISILTEPQNSIVKQYQKLLSIDGVSLEFEAAALKAVAKQTMLLNTGARGLRTIVENVMLNIMYETPSDKSIKRVIITEKSIQGLETPIIHKEENA